LELFVFLLIVLGLAAAAQQYSRSPLYWGASPSIAFGVLTVKGAKKPL